MSSIAWLDTSADEQRRIREVIALFTQKETLDELGIGQIRDAFSDALFPGITTIQTRARYFLLVPWAYVKESRAGRSAAEVRGRVEQSERDLVRTLNRLPQQQGVIGARAGAGVKNLPSSIYWNGLLTLAILRRDTALDQLTGASRVESDGADEPASRSVGDWHPTLPAVPDGFPWTLHDGLNMTAAEASWLRERILESVPDTLLAHIVAADAPPAGDSPYPWRDPICQDAPDPVARILLHAALFSLTIQGATRLYEVLLSEAYEEAGFTTVQSGVEEYHEQFRAWLDDVDDARHQLEAWDRHDFWNEVRLRSPRVSPRTRLFVDAWTDGLFDGTVHAALESSASRKLISNREATMKGRQARLTNRKLLGQWGGGGGGGLSYRWATAKRILSDIHEGLARV